jgi:hypothetical protein
MSFSFTLRQRALLRGFFSAFDLGFALPSGRQDEGPDITEWRGPETDALSIQGDFRRTFDDLRRAIQHVQEEMTDEDHAQLDLFVAESNVETKISE